MKPKENMRAMIVLKPKKNMRQIKIMNNEAPSGRVVITSGDNTSEIVPALRPKYHRGILWNQAIGTNI